MKPSIGIIGLGYVGLPLALALAEKHTVLGYDTNKERVASLQSGGRQYTRNSYRRNASGFDSILSINLRALKDCYHIYCHGSHPFKRRQFTRL